MRHRTFQHSVYPVSPGLLRQPSNYVTQEIFFFLRVVCAEVSMTLCFCTLCMFRFCPLFFCLKLSWLSFDTHSHINNLSHPPAAALFSCDSVFFRRPLCNLVSAWALHVGNVSELSRELRLAHRAHSPTVQPFPLPPNPVCSDASPWSPWQLPLQESSLM